MRVVRWILFCFALLYLVDSAFEMPEHQSSHLAMVLVCSLAIITTYLRELVRKN